MGGKVKPGPFLSEMNIQSEDDVACVCGIKEDFKREVSPVVVSAASTFELVIINCPVWKTWKLGVRVCTGRRCHLDRVWLGFNL